MKIYRAGLGLYIARLQLCHTLVGSTPELNLELLGYKFEAGS